jgi:hypothetical protein
MTKSNLPPLPEPDGYSLRTGHGNHFSFGKDNPAPDFFWPMRSNQHAWRRCFSEDQVRSIQLEAWNKALEMAKKKCIDWAADHAKHDGCNYVNCDYFAAATDCAEEILSLKEQA